MSNNNYCLTCGKKIYVEPCQVENKFYCCDNMDLELCNSYPLHDMLLDYMLGNEEFEVIDYKFRLPHSRTVYYGFIKFMYRSIIFTYNFVLGNKIEEYACLNCRSVVQDEKYIKDLHDFIDREYESEKRKMKAKEICKEAVKTKN